MRYAENAPERRKKNKLISFQYRHQVQGSLECRQFAKIQIGRHFCVDLILLIELICMHSDYLFPGGSFD